ncbi:MAG: aldo/keto reductase [Clostridiales bacterium]|jgi:predicted aldo/keto reductase-like oxidoreductase|nr:aldo/keto reductase [Clostridiales bacterium]
MEKRKCNEGGDISLLGFGCMRMPCESKDSPKIDRKEAFKLLDYAYANGVNYYDTAWMYHGGDSEPTLGAWLKTIDRSTVKVATKMPMWEIEKPGDLDRVFDTQMQRLGVGYFDFYLVHALDGDNYKKMKDFGAYEFLKKKKERGIIKRLGFSFHGDRKTFDDILAEYKWDFTQIQLNYIDWDGQNAKYYYGELADRKIPVVIMEPVRGGLLAAPCKDSADIFKAAAPDRSVASWALRYVGSLPGVMTVLSGMSTLGQVKDNIATFGAFEPLSDAEQRTVADALAAYKKFSTIPCTGCRYCMDCPSGVDIPANFKLYNAHRLGEKNMKESVRDLKERELALSCTECKKCVPRCPQGIDIPKELKQVAWVQRVI